MRALALALLLAGSAAAQDFSPPEGAHLAGATPRVMLRWTASNPTTMLTVLQGRTTIFQGPVSGDHYLLENLTSGGFYTWTVGVGGDRHFQYSSEMELHFDGADGRDGDSGRGGSGANGQAVTVELRPAGEYTDMRVEGLIRSQFLLLPDCGPVTVTARGGAGGAGAPGRPGLEGTFSSAQYIPPGDGGPGAPGGDGGDGGSVTLRSGGLPAADLLRFDLRGGPGGRGGAGGPGGQLEIRFLTVRAEQRALEQFRPTRQGNSGPAGPAGRDGRPGQVRGL